MPSLQELGDRVHSSARRRSVGVLGLALGISILAGCGSDNEPFGATPSAEAAFDATETESDSTINYSFPTADGIEVVYLSDGTAQVSGLINDAVIRYACASTDTIVGGVQRTFGNMSADFELSSHTFSNLAACEDFALTEGELFPHFQQTVIN